MLLIAEAANPEWASVPLEGWCHSQALSTVADTHLVTQVRNAAAIRRTGLGEEKFTVIDSEKVAAPLYKLANALRGGAGKGWTMVTALGALAYPHFELLVWKAFGSRIQRKEFDLVHRLTPLSPTAPSPIAARVRRAQVPFVVGPLNGGVPWPRGFSDVRVREREWLSYVRGAYRFLPWYRATREQASAIIAGSRSTYEEIPLRYRSKCVYIPENAVDPSHFGPVAPRRPTAPLRLAFVGRLVPYKGADIVLEAIADVARRGEVALDLIGDGPEMPRLRELVARLSLGDAVHMPGWIPHDRLQSILSRADVFAFPSVREFGGAVVLEAMALGVVPIVADYGGPSELVTASTGFLLPMGSRTELVDRMRGRIEHILRDRSALAEIAARARARVLRHFTWEKKARQVYQVYRWVCGKRAGRPDFGMPLPDT